MIYNHFSSRCFNYVHPEPSLLRLPTLKFWGTNLAKIFVLHNTILLALQFKTTEQALNFAAEGSANVLIHFIFYFKNNLCGCQMAEH